MSLGRPCHFCQRSQSREHLISDIFGRITELRPHRSLQAHQQRFIIFLPVRTDRFIRIDILQRIISEIRQRLKPLGSLITDQIHQPGRCHHEAVSLGCCLQGRITHALPAKDDCPVGQGTVGQFVPSHHLFALALHILAHAAHEITLQFLDMRNTFLLHAVRTPGTFLPVFFPGLIASQMNVMRRKQFRNLVNHPFQKTERFLISGTENDITRSLSHTRNYTNVLVYRRASQLRISSQCRIRMSRHINFRNNLNATAGSITDNFLHILLSIIASYRRRLARLRISAVRERTVCLVHSPRSHGSKPRIFLDFQPPSVIIRQMQMQLVQFKHRHTVDDLHQFLLLDKIS